MNPLERTSHPSGDQVRALLGYLTKYPQLAKGFARTQSARERSRKHWLQIAMQLNSMQCGAVKSWSQWTKYWRDKKSSVKKKAAARAACMLRNNGEVEDALELSELEESVLAIMGIEGFDHREAASPFVNYEPDLEPLSLQNVKVKIENNSPEYLDDAVAVLNPLIPEDQNMHAAFEERTWEADETVSMSDVPQQQDSQPNSDDGKNESEYQEPPRKRRRYVRRVSLAIPNRPHYLASFTKRFLKLEEQRIEIQRSNSELMKVVVNKAMERDTQIAKAMMSVGDGLKALAQAIRRN